MPTLIIAHHSESNLILETTTEPKAISRHGKIPIKSAGRRSSQLLKLENNSSIRVLSLATLRECTLDIVVGGCAERPSPFFGDGI